jgi:predicted RNA binding protein YcfA (HicA-like mRNA interferase family)
VSGISSRRLEQAALRLGWTLDRTKGSHQVFTKPGEARPIVIQADQKDLPEFIVSTVCKQLGVKKKDL